MNGEQTIPVNLKVGSWVTVFESVDIDEDESGVVGFAGTPVFEDKVVQYVPQTRKLEFADSDMGYDQFANLIRENDSVQIIRE